VQGNIVEAWGDTAIAVPACTEVVIANNVIRGRAAFGDTPTDEESGIDLLGVRHGVCTGNKIYKVRNLAIAASDLATGDGFASQNITISNNTIVGDAATTADYAIRLGGVFDTAGCGNYVISGNSITNTYYPAIGVAGPCSDVTITGNTIVDGMLEGSGDTLSDTAILIGIDYAKDAARVLCAGNTIRDTGAHIQSGIYVNAANTDNVVYGNLVSGTSIVLEAHFVGGTKPTYSSALLILGSVNINPLAADYDMRVGGDNDPALLFTDASRDAVGIGVDEPNAKLHIYQTSATGAKPVLLLNQADADQDMIEFSGTVGTGNAIEAVGAKTLTVTHYIKVTITGVGERYLPVGTIA